MLSRFTGNRAHVTDFNSTLKEELELIGAAGRARLRAADGTIVLNGVRGEAGSVATGRPSVWVIPKSSTDEQNIF